jgi:AcrR family transcriptional regulator
MGVTVDLKTRITLQARQLFVQFGIRSVSMDDIAEETGCSKKTIYQYFNDKNELVEAVVEGILDVNVQKCEKGKIVAENAVHESFLAIGYLLELFKGINPLVVYDLRKYHRGAYRLVAEYRNEVLFSLIKGSLEWGIKDGYFRKDLNVDLISRFRLESILITFSPGFQSLTRAGVLEMHWELFIHFLYGLATPSGYELISKYKEEYFKNLPDEKT